MTPFLGVFYHRKNENKIEKEKTHIMLINLEKSDKIQ